MRLCTPGTDGAKGGCACATRVWYCLGVGADACRTACPVLIRAWCYQSGLGLRRKKGQAGKGCSGYKTSEVVNGFSSEPPRREVGAVVCEASAMAEVQEHQGLCINSINVEMQLTGSQCKLSACGRGSACWSLSLRPQHQPDLRSSVTPTPESASVRLRLGASCSRRPP
eukprot:630417-Rhodomonas_salina.1